ncbi:hypothetical protein [Rhodococcus olei]
MKKPTFGRQSTRHPAVIDLLGGAPTSTSRGVASTAPRAGAAAAQLTAPAVAGSPSRTRLRRPGRTATAALGAAAIVVAGAIAIGQLGGEDPDSAQDAPAQPAGAAPVDENGIPVLNLPESHPAPTIDAPAPVNECRADRGDQRSGAGVIAAFNHAYYSQRNGTAARALATPTSSVRPGPELQGFIDAVPVGTNYCIRTIELSDGVFLVDLSVMKPGVPVERGTQTVTTATIDGRWYVDIFK